MCRAPKPKPIQTAPTEVMHNPLTDGRRGAAGSYFASRRGRSALLIRRGSTGPTALDAPNPGADPTPTAMTPDVRPPALYGGGGGGMNPIRVL